MYYFINSRSKDLIELPVRGQWYLVCTVKYTFMYVHEASHTCMYTTYGSVERIEEKTVRWGNTETHILYVCMCVYMYVED